MADVTHKRKDFEKAAPSWQKVSDVCAGEVAVKKKGDTYLPRPNPTDKSTRNQERYKQYKERAQFFGATSFTLNGLLGEVYREDPAIELPQQIDYVQQDADGAGVNIIQQSQRVTSEVMQKGRNCLFVDYPETDGQVTRAQQRERAIRAKIISLNAERVINWKLATVGGAVKLSLVVIEETKEEDTPDGFGTDSKLTYRVLRLVDGIYTVEIYEQEEGSSAKWIVSATYTPTDSKGNYWDEIPFVFVGSKNNDAEIDPIPLYDLAAVNLGHYRNSADYEDSAYLVGQPQPWIAGLNEQWAKEFFGEGVYIGSIAPFLLPVGGAFGIEQVQPNTMVKEAMDQKEGQMSALGARLVQRGEASKTVFQTLSDNGAQHSVLSVVVSNVSAAYTKCLEWVARFEGADGEIEFELNDQFLVDELDGPTLTALMGLWQGGVLPKSDLTDKLKKAGLIDPTKSQEDIDEETESESAGLGLDDDETVDAEEGGEE